VSRRRYSTAIAFALAVAVTAAVIAGAYAIVVATKMRPAYDAFGWLVWGHQALHGALNTNGAPSWKPLTFLFTFPYALFRNQMRLWMITAVAGALGGAVFGARIAWRLTGPEPGHGYARVVAAALAAIGVLGMNGYPSLVLIANSDPIVVTLCLAAVDAHLSDRPRLAFAALVLAALGRPEAWLFAGGYAIYLWRTRPGAPSRIGVALGVILIPLLWFGIPALTAKSWFIAGDVALNPRDVLHGNKLSGFANLYLGLYPLAVQLAVLAAVIWAAIRRDRTALLLVAAALLWDVIEFAFILHKWPAENRYLAEPAALMLVLAAGAVGRLLALPHGPRWLVRIGAVAVVTVLVVAVIPTAEHRVSAAHAAILQRHRDATRLDRLQEMIARVGGPSRIRSCGQPTSLVGLESAMAYELGMNVGDVGHKPGRAIHSHEPIVYFEPVDLGWKLRPFHVRPRKVLRCEHLLVDTATGPPSEGLGLRYVGPRIVIACPPPRRARRSHPRASRHSRRRSRSSRRRRGARSRGGSSRRGSSATSRRTRSTTSRKRTSRISRRGSSAFVSGCATRLSSRPRAARRAHSRSAARRRSVTRTRVRCRRGRSSDRRKRTGSTASCRRSRRSRGHS
jgi:hypothetical protein